jgi:hypothetical protein
MNFITSFTTPAKPLHPAWRFGFLALILSLLAFDIYWLATLPPAYPYPRYGTIVVGLMLLLNHLAFSFRWSPAVTATLRSAAISWIALVGFYMYSVLRVIHH